MLSSIPDSSFWASHCDRYNTLGIKGLKQLTVTLLSISPKTTQTQNTQRFEGKLYNIRKKGYVAEHKLSSSVSSESGELSVRK